MVYGQAADTGNDLFKPCDHNPGLGQASDSGATQPHGSSTMKVHFVDGVPDVEDASGPMNDIGSKWIPPDYDEWLKKVPDAISQMSAADAQLILRDRCPRSWMTVTGLPHMFEGAAWPPAFAKALLNRAKGCDVADTPTSDGPE
jgi:hypothetical protein